MSQAANNLFPAIHSSELSSVTPSSELPVSRDGTGKFKVIRRAFGTTRDAIGSVLAVATVAGLALSFLGAIDATRLFNYFDIGGAQAYAASAPSEESVRALYEMVINNKSFDDAPEAVAAD